MQCSRGTTGELAWLCSLLLCAARAGAARCQAAAPAISTHCLLLPVAGAAYYVWGRTGPQLPYLVPEVSGTRAGPLAAVTVVAAVALRSCMLPGLGPSPHKSEPGMQAGWGTTSWWAPVD